MPFIYQMPKHARSGGFTPAPYPCSPSYENRKIRKGEMLGITKGNRGNNRQDTGVLSEKGGREGE